MLDEIPTKYRGKSAIAKIACVVDRKVILQRDDAIASSVRNRLPAHVISLRHEGVLVRVELDAGFPLLALVTRSACLEMALSEGEIIFAH